MKIHEHSAQELLAERGPVLIRVLDGMEWTRERIDRATDILDEMLTRYPAVALCLVFEHGTPLPDVDIVRYIRERFDPYGDRVVVGVAFLGLGFWKTALLRIASLFPSSGHTVLLAPNVALAAEALARELVGLDPELLATDVERLRGRLREDKAIPS